MKDNWRCLLERLPEGTPPSTICFWDYIAREFGLEKRGGVSASPRAVRSLLNAIRAMVALCVKCNAPVVGLLCLHEVLSEKIFRLGGFRNWSDVTVRAVNRADFAEIGNWAERIISMPKELLPPSKLGNGGGMASRKRFVRAGKK